MLVPAVTASQRGNCCFLTSFTSQMNYACVKPAPGSYLFKASQGILLLLLKSLLSQSYLHGGKRLVLHISSGYAKPANHSSYPAGFKPSSTYVPGVTCDSVSSSSKKGNQPNINRLLQIYKVILRHLCLKELVLRFRSVRNSCAQHLFSNGILSISPTCQF